MKKLSMLLALVCHTTFGLSVLPLKDKPHHIELSNAHVNRVSVVDERINQVFADSNSIVLQKDEVNGQVFIKPLHKTTKDKVALSLTTESGVTQDFMVTFAEREANTILLKPSTHSKKGLDFNASIRRPHYLLNSLMKKKIPSGFSPYAKKKTLWLAKSLKATRLYGFVDSELDVEAFEVKNTSNESVHLPMHLLHQDHIIAYRLQKEIFDAKSKGMLWVISKRDKK